MLFLSTWSCAFILAQQLVGIIKLTVRRTTRYDAAIFFVVKRWALWH